LKFNGSESFNIGTGRGHSVREVIEMVERISGKTVPRIDSDRRPGDPPAVFADSRRAQEVLKWKPRFGLEEIVRSSFNWHEAHPNGYTGKK